MMGKTFLSEEKLQIGEAAPELNLLDQNGKQHKLSDYYGHWLVLYFYPKDNTPGCTKEACHFRDDYSQIINMGAQVLGISTDNARKHDKFINKFSLPFPLLCDEKGACAKRYDALFSLGPFKLAKRHSFIIDPNGKIARIYREVNANKHSQEVLSELEIQISKLKD